MGGNLLYSIPPFLRFPIIPGPCPPGPFHPWILSLFHPFTLSPKMQKPCKNAGKMLFFISLWVPGCSLMAPKQCKNAGFFFLQAENTVKMQVKCIFWGPRAPKSSQLGLLRCGVEAPFKLLCKTRKHCKKPCFLANFGFLGLGSPSPPPEFEGLYNQVLFIHRTTKLHATVAFLGSFFTKHIATYLVANWLRNKTVILWKIHRTMSIAR